MTAPLEVVGLKLMGIGFALEGDGEIGTHEMAILNKSDKPLHQINHVEGDVEQLTHLTSVNALVPQINLREFLPLADEDEPEEIDGKKRAEGDKTISDDHRLGQLELESLAQTDETWIQLAEMA